MPKIFSEFFLNIARKTWDALEDWKSDNTGIVLKKEDACGNYRLFCQPLTTGKITAVTGLWIKELIKFPSLNTRQCAFTRNGSPTWQRFMAFPQKQQRPSGQMVSQEKTKPTCKSDKHRQYKSGNTVLKQREIITVLNPLKNVWRYL